MWFGGWDNSDKFGNLEEYAAPPIRKKKVAKNQSPVLRRGGIFSPIGGVFCSIEFAVIFNFLLLISEIVSQNQNQITDWVDLWAVQRTDRQSLPFRSPFWRFISLVDDGGKLEVRWRVERS